MRNTAYVESSTTHDPLTNTMVRRKKVTRGEELPEEEFALAKVNQVIWYLTHLVALLLVMRFTLLLLGASQQGIVSLIYNLSAVFVAPFRGIFPSGEAGVSYFDTATIVAIIFYYILAFIITSFIRLLSTRNVEA